MTRGRKECQNQSLLVNARNNSFNLPKTLVKVVTMQLPPTDYYKLVPDLDNGNIEGIETRVSTSIYNTLKTFAPLALYPFVLL